VAKLDADVLPNLECLHLGDNCTLLDDAESTKLFAQKLLLSKRTNRKELHVRNQSRHENVGFTIIIKSMEKNETVRLLDVASSWENYQPVRDQLILSLPKMKGVWQLNFARGLHILDLFDQRIMTAFRQSVSIVEVSQRFEAFLSNDSRLKPIITRNKRLEKLDSLLGRTRRSTTVAANPNTRTLPPPCDGLWAPVLAKVGQGREGSSPVFKILCNRLATWVVPTMMTAPRRRITVAAKKRARRKASNRQRSASMDSDDQGHAQFLFTM
jgi:hypothetical protein